MFRTILELSHIYLAVQILLSWIITKRSEYVEKNKMAPQYSMHSAYSCLGTQYYCTMYSNIILSTVMSAPRADSRVLHTCMDFVYCYRILTYITLIVIYIPVGTVICRSFTVHNLFWRSMQRILLILHESIEDNKFLIEKTFKNRSLSCVF